MTEKPPLTEGLFAMCPARDARFVVVDRWLDCVNLPHDHPERKVEFLNRQLNEEINGLEASAQSLCDFPDTPWQIRMDLARQCADEARHVVMFRSVLEERGGQVGQYPVLNFQYRIISKIDTLIGRLTVQNQSFEAGGIDAIDSAIGMADVEGDADMKRLFEAQIADEIQHVRFANEAVEVLKAGNPRSVLQIGAALNHAARAFREVMGDEATEGVRYPTAVGARQEAGFTDKEIARAAELADGLKKKAE